MLMNYRRFLYHFHFLYPKQITKGRMLASVNALAKNNYELMVAAMQELGMHPDTPFNINGKPTIMYEVEYQQYPDGAHVCVGLRGDWICDCGPEGDEDAEENATRIVNALNK